MPLLPAFAPVGAMTIWSASLASSATELIAAVALAQGPVPRTPIFVAFRVPNPVPQPVVTEGAVRPLRYPVLFAKRFHGEGGEGGRALCRAGPCRG